MILALLGPEDNATFYISWMLANILFILPNALSSAVLAHFSSLDELISSRLFYLILISFVVVTPIATGLILLSKFLLAFFAGAYVQMGQPLLIILIVSIFPYTVNSLVLSELRLNEDNKGIILLSFVVFITSLVLMVIAAGKYGLLGIGFGWLIGQTVSGIISLIFYRIRKTVFSAPVTL